MATSFAGAQVQSPPSVVVSTPLQINAAGVDWTECNIAVNQTNGLEAFAVAMADGGVASTWVFVLSGGAVLYHSSLPCGGGDPIVRAEPGTGRIWASALVQTPGGEPVGPCGDFGVALGWRDPGAPSITGMYAIPGMDTQQTRDRPTIATGHDYSGGSDPRLFALALGTAGCGNLVIYGGTSVDPRDPSPTWTVSRAEPDFNNNCDWAGSAMNAVVLDSGRIVSVQRDKIQAPYNGMRPYILYSDDGGANWLSNDALQPIAVDPLGLSYPTTINAVDPSECDQPVAGDTPQDIDQRRGGAAIAVDRAPEPDHVYVAWYAKSAQNATNTDIWIAKSENGGASWSSDPLFLMQLTDSMLGVDADPSTGVDQVMPAMAIDSCGGINLMFYDNRFDPDRNDRDEWIDCYYVRLTSFGHTAQVDHVERLTTQTFPVGPCTQAGAGYTSGFLGHYHNMDVTAGGRTLWFAYIARSPIPNGWDKNCYAHRAVVNCPTPTDLNGDGLTTESDAVLFTSAWSAQEPEADVNLDWIVNTSDFVTFVDWYQQATE
ncbi:MAG: exo-alpha-sialidase [Phycisphaerales bacterium]|nr:exo-alpha-sialidase [Phycisphaerales bacterium]